MDPKTSVTIYSIFNIGKASEEEGLLSGAAYEKRERKTVLVASCPLFSRSLLTWLQYRQISLRCKDRLKHGGSALLNFY
jgi:hypothetical protein